MNIDLYERVWMWATGVIIAVFVTIIGVSSYRLRPAPAESCRDHRSDAGLPDPRFARSASR